MRTALIAFAALMIAAPAYATDPWADGKSAAPVAASAVSEAPRSGFGDDFANIQAPVLDDDSAALEAAGIAPAAGDDGAEAAAVEPAAGAETPVITEDTGEAVEFAPGDKENKIVGP